MRNAIWLLVAPILAGLLACEDVPTTTSPAPTRLGRITLEEFRADPGNRAWFDPGYDAYPASGARAEFDDAIAVIRASFDSDQHMVVMVVKPDCACHPSQKLMPAVVKTLEAAGVSSANVTIYVTNSKMEGIDSVRNAYRPPIDAAPVFLVTKRGVEQGRLTVVPDGSSVERELARLVQMP